MGECVGGQTGHCGKPAAYLVKAGVGKGLVGHEGVGAVALDGHLVLGTVCGHVRNRCRRCRGRLKLFLVLLLLLLLARSVVAVNLIAGALARKRLLHGGLLGLLGDLASLGGHGSGLGLSAAPLALQRLLGSATLGGRAALVVRHGYEAGARYLRSVLWSVPPSWVLVERIGRSPSYSADNQLLHLRPHLVQRRPGVSGRPLGVPQASSGLASGTGRVL